MKSEWASGGNGGGPSHYFNIKSREDGSPQVLSSVVLLLTVVLSHHIYIWGCVIIFIEINKKEEKVTDIKIHPGINPGEYSMVSRENFKVLVLADLHIGHPGHNELMLMRYLNWAKDTGTRIWILGDIIENGTRNSVGKSVYEQILGPREQIKKVSAILTEYSDLIDIIIDGNHEDRTAKISDINPLEIMSEFLDFVWADYYTPILLNVFVQDNHSLIYLHHGNGGAKKKSSKMRIFEQIFLRFPSADLILMGHYHSYLQYEDSVYVDGRFKARHGVITGSFLDFLGSYAASRYEPPVLGFPVVSFSPGGISIERLVL